MDWVHVGKGDAMRMRVHRQSFLNHTPRYLKEQRTKQRKEEDPVTRKLYRCAAWLKLRAVVLREACGRCEWPGCITRPTVCDHKRPHGNDSALFFDRENLWALCKTHHDQKTARYDGGFGHPTVAYVQAVADHSRKRLALRDVGGDDGGGEDKNSYQRAPERRA